MNFDNGFDSEKDMSAYMKISGVVERIIFQNTENGYTVCEVANENELNVITGILPYLMEGEHITAYGNFVSHKTFGIQFKAEYFEKNLPSGSREIEKYLSSGMIEGIGKITAKRLAEKFGDEVFDVIENKPHWLTDVKGITPKKAKQISESFKEKAGLKNVVDFFADTVKVTTAVKIYNQFGANTVDIVKDNPYILCDRLYGINFQTADKIAKSYNYAENSINRIKAGIKYVLKYNSESNGHLFIPAAKLLEVSVQLLDVELDDVISVYNRLVKDVELLEIKIKNTKVCYLPDFFYNEIYCSNKLKILNKSYKSKFFYGFNLSHEISCIEREFNINYSEKQTEAISLAVSKGVFILTGGPGTGKTTIIRAIINILNKLNQQILLAAPTGRAAQRMSQTTGVEAKTIHRLLEIAFENNRFSGNEETVFNRNEQNPLEADVIIVDEASMIDIYIFDSLLRACPLGIKLILIGDTDQLPPVGAGNIFRDIIKSNVFSCVNLDVVFRQSEESMITCYAHQINKGELPSMQNNKQGDFFFMERTTAQSISDTVIDLCKNRLPQTYGKDIVNQIQIISPSKKGIAGTHNLNENLQILLNPHSPAKKEIKSAGSLFREGDKVMQIKNNYSIEWEQKNGEKGLGVFNGDIGTVEKIDKIEEVVTVNFDDKFVTYPVAVLDELIHAYAITVHKSQGSEYPVVILPVSNEVKRLHTRNLLYTAVTRAQKMLIIVSTKKTLFQMIENDRKAIRYTGLSEFLSKPSEISTNTENEIINLSESSDL